MVAEQSSCQKPVPGHKTSCDTGRLGRFASTLGAQLFQKRDGAANYTVDSGAVTESHDSCKCEDCHDLCADLWCKNCYITLCSECDGQVHHSKSNHVRIPFGSRVLVKPRSPQSVLASETALGDAPRQSSKVGSPKILSVTAIKGSQAKFGASDLLWTRGGLSKVSADGPNGEKAGYLKSAKLTTNGGSSSTEDGESEEQVVGSFTEDEIFVPHSVQDRGGKPCLRQDRETEKRRKKKGPEGPGRKEGQAAGASVPLTATSGNLWKEVEIGGASNKSDICQKKVSSSLTSLLKGPASTSSLDLITTCTSRPPAKSSTPSSSLSESPPPASTGLAESGGAAFYEKEATTSGLNPAGLMRSASVPISSQASRGNKGRGVALCSAGESESSSSSPASPHGFPACSSSCPGGRPSALRGSRLRPSDLHVRWAPEVWDPPPSSASHTLGSSRGSSRRRLSGSSRTRRKGDQGKGGEGGKGKRMGKNSSRGQKSSSPNAGGQETSKKDETLKEQETVEMREAVGKGSIHEEGESEHKMSRPGLESSGGPQSVDRANEEGEVKPNVTMGPAHSQGMEECHQAGNSEGDSGDGEWSVVGRKGSRRTESRGEAGKEAGQGSQEPPSLEQPREADRLPYAFSESPKAGPGNASSPPTAASQTEWAGSTVPSVSLINIYHGSTVDDGRPDLTQQASGASAMVNSSGAMEVAIASSSERCATGEANSFQQPPLNLGMDAHAGSIHRDCKLNFATSTSLGKVA